MNLTEAALKNFTVTVACASTPFPTGSATTSHSYALTSTATYSIYGKPDYVRRVVSATFTDAN